MRKPTMKKLKASNAKTTSHNSTKVAVPVSKPVPNKYWTDRKINIVVTLAEILLITIVSLVFYFLYAK